MSSFLTGFLTALPLMLVIGPISVLLVEVGVRHRSKAVVAAAGVSTADLALGAVAWTGGTALARQLTSIDSILTALGVAGLLALAFGMARHGIVERRQLVGALPGGAAVVVTAPADTVDGPSDRPDADGGLARRLFLQFFGMTLVNPLTVMAMVAMVVAGGAQRSSFAWVGGVGASSFVAHGTWALVGAGLGAAIRPSVRPWIRLCGAVALAGTAAWFALG